LNEGPWMTIHRLKKNNEEMAALQLGNARGALASQNDTLDQLKRYMDDYSMHTGLKNKSVKVHQLRGLSNFCDQLKGAIRLQETQVKKYEQSLALCLEKWRTAYTELETIETLMRDFRERESLEQSRLERGLEDDLVSTAFSFRANRNKDRH